MFLPYYRLWVVGFSLIACLGTWYLIERTKLGAYLRAANERAELVEAFGVNVPKMITLTYGFGVGLAALGGVLAAPIYSVSPSMGSSLIVIVFAVVVIGGMGSISGAIVSGYALGLIEGLTKVFYPAGANMAVFAMMILALMVWPSGLFSKSH
jgi:branched-chain amino acid transport system permease protein